MPAAPPILMSSKFNMGESRISIDSFYFTLWVRFMTNFTRWQFFTFNPEYRCLQMSWIPAKIALQKNITESKHNWISSILDSFVEMRTKRWRDSIERKYISVGFMLHCVLMQWYNPLTMLLIALKSDRFTFNVSKVKRTTWIRINHELFRFGSRLWALWLWKIEPIRKVCSIVFSADCSFKHSNGKKSLTNRRMHICKISHWYRAHTWRTLRT